MVKRRRIALVSLSLVLLLFALAGGRMKNEATWMNLPLGFDRPWVILVAAWVVWLYFLYRYLLVASTPWQAFNEEVLIRAMNEPAVWQMSLCAFERADIPEKFRIETLGHINDGYRFAIVRHKGAYCFQTARLYRPAVQGSPAGATDYGFIPLTPAEVWKFRRARASAMLKAMALENTFSDDVLPLLLVIVTPPVWFIFYWHVVMRWLEKSYGKVSSAFRENLKTNFGLAREEIDICLKLATSDLSGSGLSRNLTAN